MDASKGFDKELAFRAVDSWNYGYIDKKNLKLFLKNHGSNVGNWEVMAVIRRMDLDADARLCRAEFIEFLRPEEPYSKMVKR